MQMGRLQRVWRFYSGIRPVALAVAKTGEVEALMARVSAGRSGQTTTKQRQRRGSQARGCGGSCGGRGRLSTSAPGCAAALARAGTGCAPRVVVVVGRALEWVLMWEP